jgi:hypothetical protein
MTTRYDTAWSGIALALVEAERWPRPRGPGPCRVAGHLRRDPRHAAHLRLLRARRRPRPARCRVLDPAARIDHAEDRVVEPLAVATDHAHADACRASRAITALAIHDDYQAAADAIGVRYHHPASWRSAPLASRFQRRWYAPDTPPTVTRNGQAGPLPHALGDHCPQGHAFTPENTWRPPGGGGRRCRTCMAAARPGARARAAEAAAA